MHSATFDLGAVRLEALTAGPSRGRLVILLHGFPESGDAWRVQAAALAGAGWRVLAPHQRGYAGSSKPAGLLPYRLDVLAADVLALADAAGAETFSLVGHDWGAAIAWHLASTSPTRLDRMVVMNGPHAGTVGLHTLLHPTQLLRSWYIGAFQVPFLPEALLRADDFALLRRAMRDTARPGALPDALLDRYAAQWAQPGALGAMLAWYRAIGLQVPTPARTIELPVTVIWGEQDPMLDRGLADAALRLCSKGRLVALPDATHWLHHEEPQRVNDVLLEALA
ncbi:alpha/beta hydrolase [Ramlibacter sp.]|uniref:alpha/beta fold hydrolase n=1 Tax=Ramlibacter sp. TaxID=1917967 RepID=UPI002D42CD7B|nr:alpha/beta hydrolase [Ramlibacter sp.]HYD77948.1 alpha/beta hydrolase [Ramlibacter sp.]